MSSETNLKAIRHFIGRNQIICIGEGLKGEEKSFFVEQLEKLAKTIEEMPKSYETDGQKDEAKAILHYFNSSMDWYITEKDIGSPDDIVAGVQHQAFGLANIGMGCSLGYISIKELIDNNVELDMYFTPCTIGEVKEKYNK